LKVKVKLEKRPKGLTFQDLILRLSQFWVEQGCVLQQPYDVEVGAGTMHPETFLRVLGPHPYRVGYVQPSRRPADGRYGENPNRLYKHTQFQVILKPSPVDIQGMYLKSLGALGINLKEHDIRFEEDNWESPTLGAWGIGWQVLLDGLEITQFTYFQQSGGIDLDPISVELTYGLERVCAFLQGVESVYDLRWSADKSYGDIRLLEEQQFSEYSFDRSDAPAIRARRIQERGREGSGPLPAACGLRSLPQVLASVQSDGCARGDLHHRACRAHGPCALARVPHGRRVSGTAERLGPAA